MHNRITYVDRLTVRLTGTVIMYNGPGVPRHPVQYTYDEKRKKGKKRQKPPDRQSLVDMNLSRFEVERRAEAAAAVVKQLGEQVKPLQKDLKTKLAKRSAASLRLKSGEPGAYESLWAARKEVQDLRRRLLPLEAAKRVKRNEVYTYNKLAKAKGTSPSDEAESSSSSDPGVSTTQKRYTTPTWNHPATTDNVYDTDITHLMDTSHTANGLLAFGGTDYGITIMSQTIAQDLNEVYTHINRFSVLSSKLLLLVYLTHKWSRSS